MENSVINLNGKDVAFSFKRSSRARNLRIQISPDFGVEVIAPERMSESKIFGFINKKQGWILNKVRHFEKMAGLNKASNEVYYLGQIYKKNIINGSQNTVNFNGEGFDLSLKENSQEKDVLETWFRKEARINITGMVTELSQEYDLNVNNITIREQRTRWGSCSKAGNLNFNFRLMMAPEEVIKYVIIHELTHLTHMNHSPKFWRLVSERCPEYQKHVRWLKRHGSFLRL